MHAVVVPDELISLQCIQELREHPNCTEYIRDFLSLVENHVMVVKPQDPNDRGRIEIQELTAELYKLGRGIS